MWAEAERCEEIDDRAGVGSRLKPAMNCQAGLRGLNVFVQHPRLKSGSDIAMSACADEESSVTKFGRLQPGGADD